MSNTMAEPFCEEHLITWTEHGQDFTDWRDGDIFTGSQRMSEAGAISLFQPLEEDHLLIVTVFRDRSWIVQQEPMGAPAPLRMPSSSRTHHTPSQGQALTLSQRERELLNERPWGVTPISATHHFKDFGLLVGTINRNHTFEHVVLAWRPNVQTN